MERIKDLNGYQRSLLVLMLAMVLIFAVIYSGTISKVGYRYNEAILVPDEENGDTVYSGRIRGQKARFTVSDHTVIFQYGEKTYGPYTVTQDPTAIPEDCEMGGGMTGIEVCEGTDILFRGGVVDIGDFYMLYREDGTLDNMIGFSYMASDGVERDENGDPIDRMRPSVSTLYELTQGPQLTHKGEGIAWFGAFFICVLNAVSIVFAEELFRMNLAFRIRNVDDAEPSDWEITGRYVSWTAMTILALVLFVVGLQ